MENPKHIIKIETKRLRNAVYLLDKYFGIDIITTEQELTTIFENTDQITGEIQRQSGKGGEYGQWEYYLDQNEFATFDYFISIEKFSTLLAELSVHDDIYMSLFLFSYIKRCTDLPIRANRSIVSEFIYYENLQRKELLELYVLFQQTPKKGVKNPLTIKYNDKSLTFTNYDNYFYYNFILSAFERHMPDITSIDEAEEEIEGLKIILSKKKGNQEDSERYEYKALILNIYDMMLGEGVCDSATNVLCEFIIDYAEICGYMTDHNKHNPNYIRSTIDKMKKNDRIHRRVMYSDPK